MDRRQQKTRDAIFSAFNTLLETKKYDHITVQQIIDKANIGRSTFYAHFETKDDLLNAMCTEIFNHIFSHDLSSEKTHDFSDEGQELIIKITHILYHLKDNKKNIVGILSCESGDLFLGYFKNYLKEMFSQYWDSEKTDVPLEFVLNHLSGSFAETVKWWISNQMQESPEKVASYYMSLTVI